MKCEICHEKDAETAIATVRDGVEDELYVCGECARKERVRRQKKSLRTRKTGGSAGVSFSVTHIGDGDGDGEPPPIVRAFMDAMHDMVSDIEKMSAGGESRTEEDPPPAKREKMRELPCSRADAEYRVAGRLHLEGLFLIGEMEAVQRAFRALGMEIGGERADGVNDAGHAYRVRYSGSADRARRVVGDLLEQERNARSRLMGEMGRVFGDAVCRALAVLKNCRLLSPGELFDLLSPLRLAARNGLLDGIGADEIDEMMSGVDLGSKEDDMPNEERDRADAERADEMNGRFEDVILSESAEELMQ